MRHDLRRVQFHHGVEHRVGVRVQRGPVLRGHVPFRAADELAGDRIGAGRKQAAFDVFDGFGVHGDEASACAAFNRHVAHRHAAFHAQVADGGTGKFNRVAGAARRANLADDGQHDVLGGDALGHSAFDFDQHVLGFFGQQGLRGHDVFDFAGADAVRQRAESAVGGCVRVAADHRHAGQGGAVFGADHMHDALAFAHEGKEGGGAEFLDVGVQRGDLLFADQIGDAVVAQLPAGGWRVVVGSGHDGADAPDLAARFAQAFKRLRAGHFVNQMAVDVQNGGAVFFGVNDVLVPDFVVEGASHGFSFVVDA